MYHVFCHTLRQALSYFTYIIAHISGGIPSHEFFRSRQVLSLLSHLFTPYWRYSHSHSHFTSVFTLENIFTSNPSSRHLFGSISSHVFCRPRQVLSLLSHLFCRTHWQELLSPPYWRYFQSRILPSLTGIATHIAPFEGCITPPLTHAAVFTLTYSAIHIGRYFHCHPCGGIPSHVFCRPQQVFSLTLNHIHLLLPP